MKKVSKKLFELVLSNRLYIGICIGGLFYRPESAILWLILAINVVGVIRHDRD
jgi:hypothetical protein